MYFLSREKFMLMCLFCIVVHIKSHIIKAPDGFKDNVKNEKMYPNGTVIGAYSYINGDGSPVHVKYFADKLGYGVELKSVKIKIHESPTPSTAGESKFDENKSKINNLLKEMISTNSGQPEDETSIWKKTHPLPEYPSVFVTGDDITGLKDLDFKLNNES